MPRRITFLPDDFCASLGIPRQIKMPIHACTLDLVDQSILYLGVPHFCAFCHKSLFDCHLFYECSEFCRFVLHASCVVMELIKYEEDLSHIQHFSHKHPMLLVEICTTEQDCFACQSLCLGAPTYACAECSYVLHKRCAECPNEVTHLSHPNHHLFLHINRGNQIISCNSCEREYYDCFIFKCSDCNWNVCIDCYLLPKRIGHDQYNTLHSHQDHPQNLTLSIPYNAIVSVVPPTCNFCFRNFTSPYFECTTCDFIVDVECALTPPITLDGKGYFRHFNHPHAMIFVYILAGDENCFACNLSSKTGLAYSCTKCKFFLHKACADQLPAKLLYPLHKHQLLVQLPHKEFVQDSFFCWSCHRKDGPGFHFQCVDCHFKICSICILEKPVNCEGHRHPLHLVENIHSNLECNAYDGYCKLPFTSVELYSTESCMFRCVDCNFNLHLLCGPLPKSIEAEYHIHALIFVNSVVEDDSGEYYCYVCEEDRDPGICVYYCQECKYVAHVHCVISKVITALRGDLKDTRLKIARIKGVENASKEKQEMKKIIKMLPEYEQIMLWRDFDWEISLESQQAPGVNIGDVMPTWVQRLSRFTIGYCEDFIAWLDESYYSERLKQNFNALLEFEVVNVGGYMIPQMFIQILVQLLRQHGDIGNNSVSMPEMKSLTFCFFCQVLLNMSKTKLVDVTKDQLKEWFFYLNYAQRRGFNTAFLFNHLKNVVLAFIGLQAVAERNNIVIISMIKTEDILKLHDELESLKAKSYGRFVNWGEFTMECLSLASKLIKKDHVAVQGFY